MAKKTKVTPAAALDATKMVASAWQYAVAFQVCQERRPIEGTEHVDQPLLAAITNGLLSVEISLKGLLVHAGKDVPQTHDLMALLDLLPSDSRQHIEQYVAIATKMPVPRVLERIRELSLGFEQWRYYYEGKFPGTNLVFIDALVQGAGVALVGRVPGASERVFRYIPHRWGKKTAVKVTPVRRSSAPPAT